MDQKAISETIVKALEESLPAAVETVVSEKMKEVTEGLKASNEDIKKQLEDISVQAKFAAAKDGEYAPETVSRIGKFWKAFAKQDFATVKTLSEGTDSAGGYLVPTEFHKEVIRVANISGIARRLCRIIPMGTDSKDITTLTGTVTTYIVGENSSITASDPAFGRKVLTARKFAGLVHGTAELIDDNMSDQEVFTLVAELVGEALAELEDSQVLTGSGSGLNMTGVLSDTGVNLVTMASTKTSFADVTYDNLVDMVNAVNVKYKRGRNARWFMSQAAKAYIEKIKDTTGRPIFHNTDNPELVMLLGYPVELSDAMPSTSAAGTKFIAFGDLKFFALGDRKAITAEEGYVSGNFEKDVKSLKIIERVAGTFLIPESFSVLKTAAA